MRRHAAIALAMLGWVCSACDKAGPLTDIDASSPWPVASSRPPVSGPSGTATAAPEATAAKRVMPPRPVPTTSPTVRITMPMDVQLQAIQYMSAMQAPQPSDAPADAKYAELIGDALKPLGKPDIVSGGRLIHVQMAKGCTATLPREAIARYTSASLPVLLTHGVLVVRCADRELQCLQSTRDADDVLCTHK
ncbi:MAG: hypothetical protein FWD17_09685 [Polyangiaceae bacterium]|nr:hypothetical protein [Polyangiaceae bacterium]